MADIALEADHIWKKFKKGELYDSLRDVIPAIFGNLVRGLKRTTLEEKEFWALHDVSFQIPRGEAMGIIGPNGAGKSTMLKLLSGIMQPTKGRLTVNGKLSALIEVGAGFHPDLTGRENVYLNGSILGMTKADINGKFDEIVEFSGLSEFIDTPVKRYSSGMYARLGFSVAAHVDPEILLVDEVLSVGDWAFQNKCMRKMTSVIAGGATVIFVSHNLRAVSSLCQKAVLLDHGKVVTSGESENVVRHYLESAKESIDEEEAGDVSISKVTLKRGDKPGLQFQSGEKAQIDVEVTSKIACQNMNVEIGFMDQNYYRVFHVSTERLGHGTFAMEPGETRHFMFEVTLNLARGQFDLWVCARRYDTKKLYHTKYPAASVYIDCVDDVRGAVNLFATLLDPVKQDEEMQSSISG
jgi:ABC-type polysaccharide/polyol phosphate transport system ATPase subunit